MSQDQTHSSTSPTHLRVLNFWQVLSFGLLTMPFAIGGLVLVLFIPTYYAIDLGLGLTGVGLIFALGRLLDVFTDPLVGNLSDETRIKWGPRMPWVIAGVPFYCIAVWLLFSPQDGVGLWYLAIVSALYFLCYTLVDVPYSSIGLEISPDIHERSYLASSKSAFQVLGALTAASIPLVFALQTGASLTLTAKMIIVLSVLGALTLFFLVPRHNRVPQKKPMGVWAASKIGFAIPAYRQLLITFFIIQTANALTAGLTVLYVTHVIGQPQLIGAFLGILFLSTALFLPLWVYLSKRLDKKRSWIISIGLCALGLCAAFAFGSGNVLGIAVLCCIIGASFGCDAIMPTSMLADIVYDYEKKGENRYAGVFLAVKNATSKLTFIVPMAIAFPVLDLVGFAKTGSNGPFQILTLTLFFAGVPIVLRFTAMVLLMRTKVLPYDVQTNE